MTLEQNLKTATQILRAMSEDSALLSGVDQFIERATKTFASGARILACGNGGSLSQAIHFAEECTGRFRRDRAPLPALALADPSLMSCIANDFGFEYVFSRQVEAQARPGDLLLLISTSGASPNILAAARVARAMGLATVGLVGASGGPLGDLVDLSLRLPKAIEADRIQEGHLLVLHSIIEGVERGLFPENYASDVIAT